MNREIEDGMGFSGLVSTRAEREQDRRDQAERKRIKALEARVTLLEAALRKVRAVLQSDSVEYDDISAVMVIIDEAIAGSPSRDPNLSTGPSLSDATASDREGEP